MRNLLLLLAALAATLTLASSAGATASPWQVVTFKDQAKGVGLYAVDALSPTDAWAGGADSNSQPLFEHWNGETWAHVNGLAVPGTESAQIDGVKVLPAGVWAVGFAQQNLIAAHGFVEHSTDGSTWTVQNLPAFFEMNAIDGSSAKNLWAVGGDQQYQPVIAHWDGTSWKKSYTFTGVSGQFLSIAEIASNDIWAIGNTYTGNANAATHPLAAHWDGRSWKRTPLTHVGLFTLEGGVAGSSATNVWTAGYSSGDSVACVGCDGVVDRLNGGAWQPNSPPATPAHRALNAIATTGPHNVWAVGQQFSADYRDITNLLQHWDGSAWTSFAGPDVGNQDDLYSITTVPGGGDSFWAVGTTERGSVILRCC